MNLVGIGEVEITEMENHKDPLVRDQAAKAIIHSEEIRKHMSPKGSLELPALLEKRRWEIGIPDGAFQAQCLYDKVLIWQFDANDSETVSKGSRIIRADTTKARHRMECPTGVLVGAGLLALDELRSNGVELGHIVNFTKLAIYRLPIETIAGKEYHVIVLRTGDIVCSKDLENARRAGDMKLKVVKLKDGAGNPRNEHVWVDKRGKTWNPIRPSYNE